VSEQLDIVSIVVGQLQALEKSTAQIAREADVPESWLKMFRRGVIPNPGVRQFEKIRQYVERQTA
jgi:hypothetical protein